MRATTSQINNMLVAAAAFALLAVGQQAATAAERDKLKILYFGNSLTGNSMPSLHADLGKSAGKEWTVEVSGGAGWQVWMHWVNRIVTPEKEGKPSAVRDLLENGGFDAIAIQAFGNSKLVEVVMKKFGTVEFPEPTDVGDINASCELIKIFLAKNPRGLVYIYSDWPGIQPKLDEAGKPLKEKSEGDGAGFDTVPDRDSLDFSALWDAPLRPEEAITAYRAYDLALLAGIKKRFPEPAESGRLRMIPVGEVLYTLDQQIKAGKAPAALGRVADFYTDGIHFRAGLPRYLVTATFFATLFGTDPGRLDYSLYNDRANFASNRNGGKFYVHQPDLGQLFTITPELAGFVNKIIWQVVSSLPETGVKE